MSRSSNEINLSISLQEDLAKRFNLVRDRLKNACVTAGRNISDIQLIAVSKKQSLEKIRILYELGQRDFGENYLNELQSKHEALSTLKDIRWHYIGLLQSHKLNSCFQLAEEIQTLCSLKHAQKLNQLAQSSQKLYPVYIQINAEKEVSKGGIFPEDFATFHTRIQQSCPHLNIRGVMAIPSPLPENWDKTKIPESYVLLRQFADLTSGRQLSLGMSSDLETAILAGSTCVRIGEALFGPRM